MMQLLRLWELWKLLFDKQDDSVAFMMPAMMLIWNWIPAAWLNSEVILCSITLGWKCPQVWVYFMCLHRLNNPVFLCEAFLVCRKRFTTENFFSRWVPFKTLQISTHSLVFLSLSLTSVCSLFLLALWSTWKKKKALDIVEQFSGPRVNVEVRGGGQQVVDLSVLWKRNIAVNCHLLHETQNLLWCCEKTQRHDSSFRLVV